MDVIKCSPEIFPRGSYKIIIKTYLDCAPQEEINQKLKTGSFGFVFTDYLINQRSSDPFKIYGSSFND